MKLRRTRVPNTKDVRLTNSQGEDFGRAQDGTILYPDDLALEVVQAINGRQYLVKENEELRRELAHYKVSAKDMKPLDLCPLSRHSDMLHTSIRFEDCDLREMFVQERENGGKALLNWLTFGECRIHNEGRACFIEGPMRDGITDFEHDTCKILRIGLVGLRYQFTHYHVSYFDAFITPDPEHILIQSPDYTPEKVEDAEECEKCPEHHWLLPEGHYVPPMYEFARVVAGQRITICMGPNWSKLDSDDDD